MSLYIRGSDVSAVCGKNKYQPVCDILFKKIYEYNHGIYKDITKTGDKKLDETIQKLSTEKGDLTDIVNEIDLTDEEKKIVLNNTAIVRGNVHESNDLQKYVNKKNVENRENNIDKKTTIRRKNDKIYTFKVWGISIRSKIDGVEYEDDVPVRLVENKRRRNRLFNEIPEYEKVQLEVYLRTTNLKYALHIENFKDDNNVIEYIRDDIFWDDITTGIYVVENNKTISCYITKCYIN